MFTRSCFSIRTVSVFAASMLLSLVTADGIARADAVRWRTNLDAAKIEAAQSGRLVLLHFWSSSCGPCRALDNNVFSQPHVGVELEKNYVPIKVNTDQSSALASLFRINRVPTDVVLTPQGNLVSNLQCPPTAEGYLTQLKKLSDHYRLQASTKNIAASETPFNAAYAGLEVSQKTSISSPAQQQKQVAQQTASQITNPWIPKTPSLPEAAEKVVPATMQNRYEPAVIHSPFAASKDRAVVPATAMPQSYHRQNAQLTSAAESATGGVAAPSAILQASTNSFALTENATKEKAGETLTLPSGSPPLGFDGFCPVSLNFAHKWIPGNTKFGAVHRGRTYLFVGEAQRQQFLASPDTYSPVFSGMDPVLMLDEKKAIEGRRKFGYKWRDAFYLFSSQATMEQFASNPDHYTAGIRQAMSLLDGVSGTVRR